MSEFRADIGTSDKGTYVRVVHEPTGKERLVLVTKGSTYQDLISRLTSEIEQELEREKNGAHVHATKSRK
jgi:hypothetical protein